MAPETPKGVSSRLLTMKFMQRAVASASSNASSDADTPSAKKRKFEHSSPQGRLNVDIDEASIKAALDRQEATRRAALQQHSSTDTEWVVTPTFEKHTATKRTQPRMNIVYVGYGDIDSADDSCDGEDIPSKGRTSTRKPKESEKTLPRKEDSDDGNSDASQDSEEEDSSSSPRSRKRSASMADSRSRSQSRSRPSAESLKAKEFRDKRKKKEIQLNKLTSISSAGGGSPQSSMTCYNCHKTGHRAVDCPKKGPAPTLSSEWIRSMMRLSNSKLEPALRLRVAVRELMLAARLLVDTNPYCDLYSCTSRRAQVCNAGVEGRVV